MHRDKELPYRNWDKVAEIIGGEVTVDRLLRLAQALDEGQHIGHGVKEAEVLERIKEEGIIANSHGKVSFWAFGSGIFTPREYRNPVDSLYDSPFFNYGHSRKPKGHMVIALTRRDLLGEIINGEEPRPDYSVTLGTTVPRERFVLLHVVGGSDREQERAMFELLEEAVEKGYAGGEERVRDLDA